MHQSIHLGKKCLWYWDLLAVHHYRDVPVHVAVVIISVLSDALHHLY